MTEHLVELKPSECWSCGSAIRDNVILIDQPDTWYHWTAWLYDDYFKRVCCVNCGAWKWSERIDRRIERGTVSTLRPRRHATGAT